MKQRKNAVIKSVHCTENFNPETLACDTYDLTIDLITEGLKEEIIDLKVDWDELHFIVRELKDLLDKTSPLNIKAHGE